MVRCIISFGRSLFVSKASDQEPITPGSNLIN